MQKKKVYSYDYKIVGELLDIQQENGIAIANVDFGHWTSLCRLDALLDLDEVMNTSRLFHLAESSMLPIGSSIINEITGAVVWFNG